MTTDIAPPLAAGRLRLRRILGVGGVGTVYQAYDERLDVDRAVKVLSDERAGNAVQRQRFLTEARIQARLRHANVVEVYDIEDDGTHVYIVMELVPGGSLWDRLREEGPLAPGQAVDLILGILDALEQAHAMDVVHRDIKPHNILLTAQGRPKLADFGVAQLQAPEQQDITRTGMVMGTWAFMAPEQRVSSRRVDRRSDLYSVGATLFTLLTGTAEPDLFDFEIDSEVYAPLPPQLRPIVRRATRYARSERFPTAAAMREDLGRAGATLSVEAAPAPARQVRPEDVPEPRVHLSPTPGPAFPSADPMPAPLPPPPRGSPSGTLVPSLAEVERLLATPPAGMERPTFSDDGRTVDVPHRAPSDTRIEGSPHIPLPITEERPSPPQPVGWTLDEEPRPGLDDEEQAYEGRGRGGARLRGLALLLAAGAATGVGIAALRGWDRGSTPPTDPGTPATPTAPVEVPPPRVEATAEPPQDPAPPPPRRAPPASPRGGTTRAKPPVSEPAPPPGDPPEAPPEPPPAEPDPLAGLSVEDLRRVVRVRNEPQIFACYEEALATNPRLEGVLTLRWGIEDGQVVSAAAIQVPGNHEDLRRCAVAAVSTWRYPAGLDDTPPSQDWKLNPRDRTSARAGARIAELQRCTDGLAADLWPTSDKGELEIVVVEGVVQEARMLSSFGSPTYDACLVERARSWVFPPWANSTHTLHLSVLSR